MLRLRVRGPDGSQKVISADGSTPYDKFIADAAGEFSLDAACEALVGFPPKPVEVARDAALSTFAASGDTVVLRAVASSAPAPAPATAPTRHPQRRRTRAGRAGDAGAAAGPSDVLNAR